MDNIRLFEFFCIDLIIGWVNVIQDHPPDQIYVRTVQEEVRPKAKAQR
jgi:hypothetical protein